jgi:hypothetical protein
MVLAPIACEAGFGVLPLKPGALLDWKRVWLRCAALLTGISPRAPRSREEASGTGAVGSHPAPPEPAYHRSVNMTAHCPPSQNWS